MILYGQEPKFTAFYENIHLTEIFCTVTNKECFLVLDSIYIYIKQVILLKAHLQGIPEVVPVLRNEAIAHVSGMQSSCKGRNITACSASKQNIIANMR